MTVLAAAAVITAATSPADAVVTEEVAGASFLLTPEAPLVTIPVTFDATRAAFRRGPEVLLAVTHSAVWTGVEDASPELIDVQLVPHDTSGTSPEPRRPHCRPDECRTVCNGRACVGSHDLVFRWPGHLEEGSVRIEWAVEGTFTWHDRGFFTRAPSPADGTELSFEFGELTGGAAPPTSIAAWETDVAADLGVVEEAVTVATRGSLDGGVLALEPRFDPQLLRVALPTGWQADEAPSHLATAMAEAIPVPEHCHAGPCTFTFDTLTQAVRPGMSTSRASSALTVEWTITSTTPVEVEVASRRAEPSGVSAQANLGRIVLQGDDATDGVRFVVTLPAAALPTGEWPPELADLGGDGQPHRLAPDGPAGAGPVVMLELRPDVDPATVELNLQPDIEIQLSVGRDREPRGGERIATWSEWATPSSQWGPWRTALHNRCLPDQSCEIEVEVRATTGCREPPDGEPVVALDLDAEVVVMLPWTRPPPSETPDIRLVNRDGVPLP